MTDDNRVTTALLLAAGTGSRLLPLTLDAPKCLTEIGGKSMPEAGRHIRMASRTSAENTKLVAALRSILAIENETVSTTKAEAQNNSCQS